MMMIRRARLVAGRLGGRPAAAPRRGPVAAEPGPPRGTEVQCCICKADAAAQGSLARLHCRHHSNQRDGLPVESRERGLGRFYSAQLSSRPGAAVTMSPRTPPARRAPLDSVAQSSAAPSEPE
eukprot:755146-Hanusia_phi.AAC.1